jgi:predicted nucleic-acid-binding Zn-ribbon protein
MSGFSGIRTATSRPPMSTQEKIDKAIRELKKRGVESDNCPRCGTSDWNVDLLEIPANSEVFKSSVPPPMGYQSNLSVLGIVCKNCGYTMFHNLNVLGI